MTKSKWKIPTNIYLNKKLKHSYIQARNAIISFSVIGKTFFVYNGKNFKKLSITRDHVGFKFGEFILTKNNSKTLKIKKNINLKKNGSKK